MSSKVKRSLLRVGGSVSNGISQGLGCASMAFAAVGALQEIAGAFSQVTSAAANGVPSLANSFNSSDIRPLNFSDITQKLNNIGSSATQQAALADAVPVKAADVALQDTWSPFDLIGGAVSGGKAAIAAGLNAGERAVFYTAGTVAKEQALSFASEIGGRTILDTPIGQALETFNAPDVVWRFSSRVFAESANGEAHVFIGEGASWSRTYGSIEADILDKNGVDVAIHAAEK